MVHYRKYCLPLSCNAFSPLIILKICFIDTVFGRYMFSCVRNFRMADNCSTTFEKGLETFKTRTKISLQSCRRTCFIVTIILRFESNETLFIAEKVCSMSRTLFVTVLKTTFYFLIHFIQTKITSFINYKKYSSR